MQHNSARIFSAKEINAISEIVSKIQHKPFIIEVTGTPNAGKSPAITLLARLLNKYHFRVKVIYEAASRCRLSNKYTPEFNYWTACDTIKQLLEGIDSKFDIIICERGMFDAICWSHVYLSDGSISQDEMHCLSKFYLFPFWKNHIRLVCLFKCSVKESLKRERVGDNEFVGTIVNNIVLENINSAINKTKIEYGSEFERIIEIDTTELSQEQVNESFISDILTHLETLGK